LFSKYEAKSVSGVWRTSESVNMACYVAIDLNKHLVKQHETPVSLERDRLHKNYNYSKDISKPVE